MVLVGPWRRIAVLWLALMPSCNSKEAKPAAPAPSASAPATLSTSWRQDPGHLLGVGDEAPDFEGIAHTGQRILLSKFLDKPAVVVFYGADSRAGAATLVEQIRDHWLHVNTKASMVFGIGTDPNAVHRDFATERDLPFLLISDHDGAIARAFGVTEQVLPATFVIGAGREIRQVLERSGAADYGAALRKALSAPQ